MLMFSAMFFVTGAFAANNSLAMLDKNQVIDQNNAAPAADEAPAPAEEESKYTDLICKDTVVDKLIYNVNPENIHLSTSHYSYIVPGTENIDKKNKIISFWITYIATFDWNKEFVNNYGSSFENFGYVKYNVTFDMKNKRNMVKRTVFYNCNGSVIEDDKYSKNEAEWTNIIPGSVDNSMYKELKQKYKL